MKAKPDPRHAIALEGARRALGEAERAAVQDAREQAQANSANIVPTDANCSIMRAANGWLVDFTGGGAPRGRLPDAAVSADGMCRTMQVGASAAITFVVQDSGQLSELIEMWADGKLKRAS